MRVRDVPEPGDPARARSSCARPPSGSAARTSTSSRASSPSTPGGSGFPRIQGHEIAATVEAAGPACERSSSGRQVALWPLTRAGTATRAASGARTSARTSASSASTRTAASRSTCALPQTQVFPIDDMTPRWRRSSSRSRSPSGPSDAGAGVRRRARGDPRRRADRPVAVRRRAGPRRVGAHDRSAGEPAGDGEGARRRRDAVDDRRRGRRRTRASGSGGTWPARRHRRHRVPSGDRRGRRHGLLGRARRAGRHVGRGR